MARRQALDLVGARRPLSSQRFGRPGHVADAKRVVSVARASVVSATETAAPTMIVRGLFDIGHCSVLRDLPYLNGVVVVAGVKPGYVDEPRKRVGCTYPVSSTVRLSQSHWSAIPFRTGESASSIWPELVAQGGLPSSLCHRLWKRRRACSRPRPDHVRPEI